MLATNEPRARCERLEVRTHALDGVRRQQVRLVDDEEIGGRELLAETDGATAAGRGRHRAVRGWRTH